MPWLLPTLLGTGTAVLVVVLVLLLTRGESPVAPSPRCTVTAPPGSPTLRAVYSVSPEQMGNAATIAATGRRLGVPDRAITIALATAVQESGLTNLPGGDRDSVGLFQQRPSQGWGTREQILDPDHATRAFYDALLQVPGWASMDVTQAAQRVQRSGFPEAYADHEPEARLMAVAFLGQAPAALTCTNLDLPDPGAVPADTPDVADLARTELGDARLSGPQSPTDGWAIASWLVAHAQRLALDRVAFDGRTWTAASGAWTATGPADGLLSLHRVGAP